MALIRRARPSDREKTLACAEFLVFYTAGDPKQREDAGMRLRAELGQGWAFVQALQFLAGKRAAQVIEDIGESPSDTSDGTPHKPPLLVSWFAACRTMAQLDFPPGKQPTEQEIERARALFRRAVKNLPAPAESTEEPIRPPSPPASSF